MKYFSKEIIIPIAGLIAIVFLVYMEKIWSAMSGFDAATITDTITAIASVFIAGLALWVSMRADKRNEEQARVSDMRRETQARLSVQPYAGFKSVDGQNEQNASIRNFKIIMVNKGIGPAFIKSFVMRFEGKIVKDEDYYIFFKEKLKGFSNRTVNHINSGSAIKTEDEMTLIGFDYTSHKEKHDFINKLNLVAEYQSIYKDEVIPLECEFDGASATQEIGVASNFITEEMALIHADCFTKANRWSEQVFAKMLQDPEVFWVIQSPDAPCRYGFALGQRLYETEFELLTLGVYSHERGRGYGQILLNDFIAGVKEKGGKSIFLEVAENNAPALHLYEKSGFKRVGLRTAYYKVPDAPPVDAILMRLDIKTP